MNNISITTTKRTISNNKQLRRLGQVPAGVYGVGIQPQSIQVDTKEFIQLYKIAGETNVINLIIQDHKHSMPVLIKNIHHHPVTNDILHVDFHRIDVTQAVTVEVPIEIVGESLAVKDLGGVLVNNISEIEVEALPADLPNHIVVDVSSLVEIGQTITAKDLQVNRNKVTLNVDDDEVIVSIQEQQEEEPELTTEESVEAETTVQGQSDEADAADQDKKAVNKED